MWPVIGAAVAGVLFARSKAPKTRAKKAEVLGAQSGLTWEAEDFPELGCIIVRGNGASAVFRRKPEGPGFVFDHGEGDRRTLAMLVRDFLPPSEKK